MTNDAITARDVARELQGALGRESADMAGFIAAGTPTVQEFLARHDLLTLGVERQAFHADNSQWLYYDNDFHIHINPMMKAGTRIPAHDHGVWELVGVYMGSLDHKLYRRLDDRSVPGRMELELVEHRVLMPGDVVGAVPPNADIHEFVTLEPETYLLAVTGGHFNSIRTYFSPEEGRYHTMPILSRRRSLGQV